MSVLSHRVRRGAGPPRERLLAAVAALFAFDGAVFGSWAARIPDVTAQVGTSHTRLGLALLCVSIGALASMQAAGALAARLGAGRVAVACAVLLCLAVVLPGLAYSLPALAAALLAFGAATGAVNVAANSLGVRLEAAGDRPVMPGLHAAFSLGGLAGAALGGVASGLGGLAPHLLAVGGVGLVLTGVIAPALLAGDTDRLPVGRGAADTPQPPAVPRRLLVVLGLIAGCTAYGEGAITDWGALHLRETLAASPAVAAAGYAAFSLAMATGRFAGDALTLRFGAMPLVRGGGVLAALGLGFSLAVGSSWAAILGFGAVGAGFSVAFPLMLARAGSLPGTTPGTAIATVSVFGYTGFLAGPPLIGFVSQATNLRGGLLVVVLTSLTVAVLAGGFRTSGASVLGRSRSSNPGI